VPNASSADAFLSQATEREKVYDWLGAAEFYGKAFNSVPLTDFSRRGEVQESVGYSFYRAAMQAENVAEFRGRMSQSVANYEKAKISYEKMSELGKTPRILRCDAMIAYMGYWLASDVSERKRLLDDCWRITKEALKAFEEAGDSLEYGKTYNQLSSSACDRYVFEWNFQAREKIIREALERGENTITLVSDAGDPHELTRAYVKTAMYLNIVGWYFVSDMDEKDSLGKKGLDYWQKANELSEETASLELLSISGESLEWNLDEMLASYEKAIGYAKKAKDRYMMGIALDWLAFAISWKAMGTDDPDKRLEIYQKALQCAKDTMNQFSSISYTSPRGAALWVGAPNAEYYSHLAFWETNLRKKRDLLEKAIIDGSRAIKQAEDTGYPDIIMYVHSILGSALRNLAQIETNLEEKRKLLEKALEHSNESMKLTEQLERFTYWNLGLKWCQYANLKADFSDFEKDTENRKNVLEEAISCMERGLPLCIKYSSYYEKKGDLSLFSVLGYIQYFHGELLNRLFGLTRNNEHQIRAIKAYEEAAQSCQRQNLVSRVAECHWKAAGSCDTLGEHLKAAESFNTASDDYKNAAENIPQLKDLYQDHSLYMQAWSEIEKAKHHHKRQEYGSAEEHFEKAADLHKGLKQWSYLMPNYLAWAKVEHAEDLSRKERSEDAMQAFEQAAKLFIETKKSLETQLDKIENRDEKQMATSMAKATDERHEYCVGRVVLEEAKILDKKGDHYSSSEKYGSAADTFEKLSQTLESEPEQREFKFITSLSRAWQKMTRAEAEASPSLYHEASQLFEEAKEYGSNERIKMLTLGHSRFCKALEAGTKFIDTRDAALHDAVIQHLGSAADYYVKAGFPNASEYAKATKLLFDAYVHIGNAERETDPEKKAKLYTMAEKILQTSAGSFMKAEHPEKREQVLRLLEKIKEERELALSLSEVLHAPTIVSATTAFSTPTPTHEAPVGLERFEHADIQANLVVRQKELKIGENLNLEIELVNAGKGPALLTKINEIIPEGFELVEKPEIYRVEDSYLNMRGKRLDPLKMEDVKLILKPKAQGTFPLKPTVLYLDENGKYKSHEPDPITITVKELGIKGWLKGEG
jgi:tetratricopeptide (TPR) repeat protein